MNAANGNPVVGKLDKNGEKVYYKKFTSDHTDKVERYSELMELGVGVPFEETDDGIKMEGGHTLEKLIDEDMLRATDKRRIALKLKEIQKILRDNHWAHCDVKLANV